MIYTLTLNPAIDYVVKTESLNVGRLNRCFDERMYFGGKGINVSRILKELSLDSVALGFIAGFTGDAIKDGVEALGIATDFVRLENGNSRINVKLKADVETELNGGGPTITDKDKAELFKRLGNLKGRDILVMSGSVPKGMDNESYCEIMKRLADKDIEFIVDAAGDLLKKTLKYKPLLIKPNKQELEQFFAKNINSIEEIIGAANEMCRLGARNVMVSLGAGGAVFVRRGGLVYKIIAPKGEALNSVGAGDSMVAGFLFGMANNYNIEDTLRLSVAAGSATAFCGDLAEKHIIMKLIEDVSLEQIK